MIHKTKKDKLRWHISKPAFQTLADGNVAKGTQTTHYITDSPGNVTNITAHRVDGPAKTVVLVSGGTKTVVVEDYYVLGKLHREIGPALIRRQMFGEDAVTKIVVAEWYYNGINLTDFLLNANAANSELNTLPQFVDFENTVVNWESMRKDHIKNSYVAFVQAMGVGK